MPTNDTRAPSPDPVGVRDRLTAVIDPELGLNIVDLGLVYDVTVDDDHVGVTMTVTTPACPLGSYLRRAVEDELADLAGGRPVVVDITMDPPWDPTMISERGRSMLGWVP